MINENAYSKHSKVLLAIDCIIFGFDGNDLKGLVVKRKFEPRLGNWSLMGGVVDESEGVDDHVGH